MSDRGKGLLIAVVVFSVVMFALAFSADASTPNEMIAQYTEQQANINQQSQELTENYRVVKEKYNRQVRVYRDRTILLEGAIQELQRQQDELDSTMISIDGGVTTLKELKEGVAKDIEAVENAITEGRPEAPEMNMAEDPVTEVKE